MNKNLLNKGLLEEVIMNEFAMNTALIHLKQNLLRGILVFCLLLLNLTPSQSTLIRTLDEEKVIEAPLSKEDLTRIKVEHDRILHVFGNAGEYILETDDSLGQIFIRLASSDTLKPLSLTLITEKGKTQDLRFLPQTQASETIILKSAEEESKNPLSLISRDEVETLIEAARTNRIPLGYKPSSLSLKSFKGPDLKGPALHPPYRLIRALKENPLTGELLKGAHLYCLTYEVTNPPLASDREQTLLLSPEGLTKTASLLVPPEGKSLEEENIVAILIPKPIVYSGERTKFYVVALIF